MSERDPGAAAGGATGAAGGAAGAAGGESGAAGGAAGAAGGTEETGPRETSAKEAGVVAATDGAQSASPPAASDRERALKRLSSEAASGGLTLDEFTERAIAIERAASADELDAVLAKAREQVSQPVKDSPRWLFNVFGGTDQRGRWRLGRRLRIFAFLGGASLDLGAAQPAAPECAITVVALLGGVELTAPPGVTVQMSGVSLLGGKTDERAVGPSLPGSPLIHVRALAVLGGVKIAERQPSRSSA